MARLLLVEASLPPMVPPPRGLGLRPPVHTALHQVCARRGAMLYVPSCVAHPDRLDVFAALAWSLALTCGEVPP